MRRSHPDRSPDTLSEPWIAGPRCTGWVDTPVRDPRTGRADSDRSVPEADSLGIGRALVSDLAAERSGAALLAAARTTTDHPSDLSAALRSLKSTPSEWDGLLAALQANRLTALAAWHARRCPQDVPARLVDPLASAERAALVGNLSLHAALVAAARRLGEAGIPAIPLKGTALAARFYPHLGLRPCGDIDLLVPRNAVAAAERTLRTLGFTACDEPSPSGHYHRTLAAGGGRRTVCLELHWDFKPAGTATLDADALWSRASRVDRDGASLWEMSPEDEVLSLGIHLSRHHFFPLILFTDIDALLRRRTVTWDELWRRAHAARLGGVLGLVLAVLAAGWDTPVALASGPIPARRVRWLAALVRHRGGLGQSRPRWGGTPFHVAFDLAAEEPLWGQASVLRHAIWPEGSSPVGGLRRIGRGVLAVARGSAGM